jgi:hypothetical protein
MRGRFARPLAGGVLLEGDVVADGGRLQDRRAQLDARQRDAPCCRVPECILQALHRMIRELQHRAYVAQ